VAEQFSVEGDDADVASGDEEHDSPAGVAVAEADVVESAAVADGDVAGLGDFVVADPVAGDVDHGAGGDGFDAGLVDVGGGAPLERAVGSGLVVVGGEAVEDDLELLAGGDGVLGVEELFEGLVEAFDLAAGLGVVGAGVLRGDAEGEEGGFGGAFPAED